MIAAFSASPLVVAGRGSWVDEVLRVAGGENALDGGARYPTVSVEVVLRAAPAVILDLSPEMAGGDLGATLRAHGATPPRIIPLRDNVFLRPGPRVGEAARRSRCDAPPAGPRRRVPPRARTAPGQGLRVRASISTLRKVFIATRRASSKRGESR